MRPLTIFVIFFIFTSTIKATQHVGNVNLNGQENFAEFFAINCDVDSIKGNITISGLDITSLMPIKNISYIEGRLTISNCRQLITIEGLNENLRITGGVELRNLIVLKNIEPLRNVNTSNFFITECRMLGDETSDKINPNVTRISIYAFAGSDLDFLSYYPNLQYIGVTNCKKLENINALSNLHELTGLSLVDNKLISDCTIDSLCLKMQHGLDVYFRDNDDSCDSLNNIADQCIALDLSCIDTTLNINSKEMLDFLLSEGVKCAKNVRHISISVQSDNELISLEGLPLFSNLTGVGIYQTKNLKSLSGLSSSSKISNVYIRDNEDLEDLGNGLVFDTENIGVYIEANPQLRSIDGISDVQSVSKFRLISNHPDLEIPENIFDDLIVEDELRLGDISSDISQVLKSVKACNSLYLDSIIMVWDDISHIEINELLSLDGIEGLTSIDFTEFPNALRSLVISNCKDLLNVENVKLQNCARSLSFINSAVVDISYDEKFPLAYVYAILFDNINIEEITLPVIDKLNRVNFQNCPNLTSIDFYSNVGEIDQLSISRNNSLQSLGDQIPKFLAIDDLFLFNNESLIDINALGHNVEIKYDLTILENPKLESCEIDAICRILNSGFSTTISDNAGNCERYKLIETCDSLDILPVFNPTSLVVTNQSTLDYFTETYSKIDSIGGRLYIYIDYADEDRVRDLSFFDSLDYIKNNLIIKGGNFDQIDSTELLDLSNFDHCDFVELEIFNVLFDRLPIIAEDSPIEKIDISLGIFDGDFSPFNAIDTLDALGIRLYNTEVELNGFTSLVHVTDFDFNNIDNVIGSFCSSLASIDELYTNDCVRESFSVFDEVRINNSLSMGQSKEIRDEDLRFDLQENCSVGISGADTLNLSFLIGSPTLTSLRLQDSRVKNLNFDFLKETDLKMLSLNFVHDIESITFPKSNMPSTLINRCDDLKELHFPEAQYIPILEISDCQNLHQMSAPFVENMNVFKLTETIMSSLDFIADETSIKLIQLIDNEQFVGCEDSLFCNNFDLGNSIILSGNNGNCNIYNLSAACGIEIPKCPTDDFHITSAQNYNTFIEEYSTCNIIPYDLTIDKSVVLDLLFLDDVSVILGDLIIQEGTNMSNDLDLRNLGYINGSLNITGGDFNSTIFDNVEVRGQLSVSNIDNELMNAIDIFSPSDLSIVDCAALVEINLSSENYNFQDFIIENCPELQKIEPLDFRVGNTFSLKNLGKYGEVNEIMEASNSIRYMYFDNLPLIDTLNLRNRPSVLLSLTNNENLSEINGCCSYSLKFLDISNCNKIEEIDLDNMLNSVPREVIIDSNDNLAKIVLPSFEIPYWKSENIEISNNPSLVDISFADIYFSTEKLIIDNNDLLEIFVVGSNVEFDADELQITNNNNLEIINVDTSSIVGIFMAEDNASLNSISGFGDNELVEFALISNENLIDVSNVNPNLMTNKMRISNNSALDICNYDFVCNHIASGRSITLSGNGENCASIADVTSKCMTNLNEITDDNLKIYPNPVFDRLAVIDDLVQMVRIIDDKGSIVLEATVELQTINVADLKAGLYFLQIEYKDGAISHKKIIKM
jgi:hypothetical protein